LYRVKGRSSGSVETPRRRLRRVLHHGSWQEIQAPVGRGGPPKDVQRGSRQDIATKSIHRTII